MPAGVGLPMIVMSMTCGEPFLVALGPPGGEIVSVALAYWSASAKLPRLIAAGSLM
jgi:hypothetical protein